jgi:hypothetical protein
VHAKLGDGGRERLVQHEVEDEVGGLHQGEARLHHGVEVLVQVAHQAAVEGLVREREAELARVGVALAPELQECTALSVRRGGHLGRLGRKELGQAAGHVRQVAIDPAQVGRVAQVGRQAGKELAAGAAHDALGAEQAAVFQHAHVDRLQHPQHGGAAREQVGPHLEVFPHVLVGV